MKIYAHAQNVVRYTKFAAEDTAILARLLGGAHLAPYIGFLGYNNLGDEVLYEAHVKLFPEHELVLYRKETVAVERLADMLRHPLCSHAILGGGTLINRQNHWIDRVEHLLSRGSKMFCLGTGVANPNFWKGDNAIGGATFNRWLEALKQFEFVGVRGPYSKASLDKAGLKSAKVTGDTALTLTANKMRTKKSTGVVGLNYGSGEDSIMWGDPLKYRTELIKVIKAIIESGSKVMLLPIRGEDLASNRALIKDVNLPQFTMVESFQTFSEYSEKIRECDVFIGQKLHSTILAYMNRVPAIMIEYRPKCRDFMASIGLEDYVVKTSEVEFKPFMKLYDRLQKNHTVIRSQSESQILEYKHIQATEAKKLRSIIAH